jgi:glycosyltransferase involved in cell wall biosynthesis
MKLIIYSETFLPGMGGVERNSYTLAVALVELKHDVTVVTGTLTKDKDSFPFSVIRCKRTKDIAKHFLQADGIIINGGVAMKACWPAYLLRRKYVVIYQMASLYHIQGTGWANMLRNRVQKFLAERAFMNVAVSESAKQELRLKNKRTAALLNPVDKQLKILADKIGMVSKSVDILFVGRIIDGKGVFLLGEAYKRLLEKGLGLTLAFAGQGEDEAAFRQYVKDNSLPVTFLGRLDKSELVNAYKSAKVLVVPSTTHTEGSPLVIAEAISFGTPVVASNQAAMIEVVGKAGMIFESGNVDELTAALYSIFKNQGLLEQITLECNNEKVKFSYENYRGVVSKIVNELNSK